MSQSTDLYQSDTSYLSDTICIKVTHRCVSKWHIVFKCVMSHVTEYRWCLSQTHRSHPINTHIHTLSHPMYGVATMCVFIADCIECRLALYSVPVSTGYTSCQHTECRPALILIVSPDTHRVKLALIHIVWMQTSTHTQYGVATMCVFNADCIECRLALILSQHSIHIVSPYWMQTSTVTDIIGTLWHESWHTEIRCVTLIHIDVSLWCTSWHHTHKDSHHYTTQTLIICIALISTIYISRNW